MAVGWEYQLVEKPLIEQLKQMGWTHLQRAPPEAVIPLEPQDSGRTGFDEVFLEGHLRDALHRINLDPQGRPWLDDERIEQAVSELTRIPTTSLLEANQKATELLINCTTVAGAPGWEGGRSRPIHYIDWEDWTANEFTVVNQFRVDIPGRDGHHIVPDVVLFVNGIPLVVLEAKQPSTSSLLQAAGQIRRYAEQISDDVRTGNQRLFHTVQLTMVSSGEDTRLGTITAHYEHYVPWRDPYPLTPRELADRLHKTPSSSADRRSWPPSCSIVNACWTSSTTT